MRRWLRNSDHRYVERGRFFAGAYITDPEVIDWIDGLDPRPECCGHPMIGWGPSDPDLFHCLHCGADREKVRV